MPPFDAFFYDIAAVSPSGAGVIENPSSQLLREVMLTGKPALIVSGIIEPQAYGLASPLLPSARKDADGS